MNQTEVKRRQAERLSDILMFITIYVMGRLTGDKGIAYTAVAATVCALLWIAVSGSLSDALGRLLRSRKNKGQYRNIARMRGSTMVFQMALGLAGSLCLAALSGVVSEKVFRIPYSWLILLALSPIVLLRTISAVLTGYFQGEGSELPKAIAGILRQVFLLGFVILFSHLVGGYGERVSSLLRQENYSAMYGGLGIALAVNSAELFVLLFLGLIYKVSRRSERKGKQEAMYATDSRWECVMHLYSARWPQFLTAVCAFLPFVLGLFFSCLASEDIERTAAEYGLYAGKYLVVCGVVSSVITIAALPVIGKIFQCFKRDENRFARTVFQSGVHIGLVHGIFLSVFVAVMGEQLADLLCPANAQTVTRMLQFGSALIGFGALSGYFSRLLHSLGKKYPVLIAAGGADILFVIVVMPGISKSDVMSLVYGGVAAVVMFCVLSGVFAYRQLRVKPDWLGTFAVPMGVGGGAGLICLLIRKLLSAHLGSLMTLLVAFALAGAVYWIALLLLRNFKEQELEAIPGGRLIGMLGQLLRVF